MDANIDITLLLYISFLLLSFFVGFIGKGYLGEKRAALSLWFSLSKKKYITYHNLIIPSSNGTAQIDHLIVSEFGLFIVETKNKKGWIFGDENSKKWTQIIFKKKYSFQNPLRQVFRQKKVLSEYLQLSDKFIIPIIYFNGKCTFKTEMPKNVIQYNPGRLIKSYRSVVLNSTDLASIKNKLDSLSENSSLSLSAHLKSLDERHNSFDKCPRCGSALNVKVSNRGKSAGQKFLGCTSYPRCKFTRSFN